MDLNEHVTEARTQLVDEICNKILNLSKGADTRNESFDELLSIIDDAFKEYEAEIPDDIGEWDQEWEGKPLTNDQKKLRQLQKYIDELYDLNGMYLSWNAALVRMSEIIREEV